MLEFDLGGDAGQIAPARLCSCGEPLADSDCAEFHLSGRHPRICYLRRQMSISAMQGLLLLLRQRGTLLLNFSLDYQWLELAVPHEERSVWPRRLAGFLVNLVQEEP